tara:strand:+ start:2133 stop:3005 length:873 start_codon:yes stop_codon:yes gene_type:complete
MVKKLSYLIYKIIKIFDVFFEKITRRSFLIWFSEFIEIDSYKKIKILEKDIKFFTPNYITNFLIDEFYTKEPETLEWINSFKKNENKIIYWDIGANIGLYSIYAALKHEDIEVVSFEPSTSNLRVLSRNISINKLEEKIKINQFPLSNVENKYLTFKEDKFMEGVALHSWGENYNFEGKPFNAKNNYKIYGTTINYLLDNNILEIPNYIKIDVDGIEHLILQGGSKYLKKPNIKSLSIELNENFTQQLESVLKIMKENNFNLKQKKRAESFGDYKNAKLKKIYNYVFERE